jgi:hypothetical protein
LQQQLTPSCGGSFWPKEKPRGDSRIELKEIELTIVGDPTIGNAPPVNPVGSGLVA